MSYILEALKKAQAERQIGSTPTIHAPTLASLPSRQGRGARRAPLIVALVLMGAAIAGLATMLVRQQPAASPPASPLPPSASAPATVTVPNAPPPGTAAAAGVPAAPMAPDAAAASTISAATPASSGAPVAAAAPVQAAPPAPGVPASQATSATKQVPEAAPRKPHATTAASMPAASSVATNVAANAAPVAPPAPLKPAPASQRVADAPAAPAAAPVEEHIQSLQELPEPIQRAIPQIVLGGYIYSKNPADRLLLIDKVLRREGEEVAPGLLLEKLQPKQAVFSFRGYRYRVQL